MMKITCFWSDLTDISSEKTTDMRMLSRTYLQLLLGMCAVLLFSKLNKFFFGYFDPKNMFSNKKINNFRGALTNVSARTTALYV